MLLYRPWFVRRVCGGTVPAACLQGHTRLRVMTGAAAASKAVPAAAAVRCATAQTGLCISSVMCGGNIEVLDLQDPSAIKLRIIPDPWCETDKRAHFQWFSYRVLGGKGHPLNMAITNAGEASFAPAWKGYRVCASYDMDTWFRVPTSWDEQSGHLNICHTPEHNAVHYAYWAPYTSTRHHELIHRTQLCEGVQLKVIGTTLDGRPMELLQVGQPGPDKRKVWILARQHPGETQAEYFMEGLLQRLTDRADPVTTCLLAKTVFYCIPNMCPDGSARGHLRTNAAGFNLNRAWAAPDPSIAPEVACTLAEMDATGVDLLLDVHADEDIPYNFVAGNNGIPAWGPRLQQLQDSFKAAFMKHSPDFQVTHGYPMDAPLSANLALCSKQVGQRFDALSLTLEMPFKDNDGLPNDVTGWSPDRAQRLGKAVLGAILDVADQLRP